MMPQLYVGVTEVSNTFKAAKLDLLWLMISCYNFVEVFMSKQSTFLVFHNYCCSGIYSTKYFRIWLVKLKIMNLDHSAAPTPIAWWCHMSGCHLSATELSRLLHLACGTACLPKLHLLSHCVHFGDWKHSCFNDLFRTSSWHSSGLSNSFFFY